MASLQESQSGEGRQTPLALYNGGVLAQQSGNTEAAKEMFQAAASKGHPKAIHNLAVLIEEEEPVKAVELYREAAKKGLVEAQYAYGLCLKDGRGVPSNPTEAAVHLKRACQKGHIGAQFALACLLEAGLIETQTSARSTATRLFRSAAESGHIGACVNLGRVLEQSDSPVTQAEAPKWYRIACDKGDALAAFNLSMCYLNGTGGLEPNPEESTKFLEIASERGHAKAQYNMACRLLRGDGVSKDLDGAILLLEKAADAGLEKPAKTLRRVMRYIREKERSEEERGTASIPSQQCLERVRKARESIEADNDLISNHLHKAVGSMHK